MLIGIDGGVERGLHGGDGAGDLHVHTVARAARHGEAVRFGEAHHGVIVGLRGAEALGELWDGQEVALVRVGRVVYIFEEGIEPRLVAQLENNVQVHDLV